MGLLEFGMSALWGVAAALAVAYLALVAKDVTYVTLADGRKQERSIPFLFKLLLPFAGNFESLVSSGALADKAEAAGKRLTSAGYEGLISGREFMALRFLVPIVAGAAWCVLMFLASGAMPFPELAPMLAVLGVALFIVQPVVWLETMLKRRHAAIVKALPFVLDSLTLSVEAGLDFINAMQRNCNSRKMDPLNEELLRTVKEIQVGSSRKEALMNMASRVGEPNLKAVAFALVQADELGVSIGAMLRIQSEEIRARRFDRAERLANVAPTKMLFPLMLFIFPAVFIVLLGPVLVQALKGM